MLGIFLDAETNGLNPHKHSLLQVAYKIVNVESGELIHAYEAIIAQTQEQWKQGDPNSLQINEFTWEEVSNGLTPAQVAPEILNAFSAHRIQRGEAVFICQNPSFDRAFFSQLIDPDLQESLNWPYHWLDLASMFWATHIKKPPYGWETGVSKDKISERYALSPETKPHRAMNGVNHLLLCYEAVVGFPELAKNHSSIE